MMSLLVCATSLPRILLFSGAMSSSLSHAVTQLSAYASRPSRMYIHPDCAPAQTTIDLVSIKTLGTVRRLPLSISLSNTTLAGGR